MDLRTLRAFIAVADGATVGEAAVASHSSQPALSRSLQRLSVEVGAPLTQRVGRRLRLTPAGRVFLTTARRVVAELEDASRAVGEAGDPSSGTVRLGFLSPLGTWLVPELLQAFRAERPRVRFELRQDGATRILQALVDGDLDLLLSSRPPRSALGWEPLMEEELVLAVPASHRLAARRRVRASELSDEPWVLQAAGYGLRRQVEDLCEGAGFTPLMAFEGHDITTLLALIGAGSGIGLFPTTTFSFTTSDVRQVALSPRVHREVGLVTVPGSVRPPSADAFAAMVRDRLGGDGRLRIGDSGRGGGRPPAQVGAVAIR